MTFSKVWNIFVFYILTVLQSKHTKNFPKRKHISYWLLHLVYHLVYYFLVTIAFYIYPTFSLFFNLNIFMRMSKFLSHLVVFSCLNFVIFFFFFLTPLLCYCFA